MLISLKKIGISFLLTLGLSQIVFASNPPIKIKQQLNGPVTQAVCVLNPTKGNRAQGYVTFTQEADGVRIVADVQYLSPGKHGFHIHEFGDCSSADGSSTGGHFNPRNSQHGGPDHLIRHVGDLGNLAANLSGSAHYDRLDKMIQLNGPETIVGRAVVVHALADDYKTQPSGNSGGRIACGVIE